MLTSSFLVACCGEIYFYHIRSIILDQCPIPIQKARISYHILCKFILDTQNILFYVKKTLKAWLFINTRYFSGQLCDTIQANAKSFQSLG